MIPMFSQSPDPGKSYTRRPGAYVIAHRHGRVLMTFQAEPEPEFQLPGGGIDPGETPMQAAQREMLEETGWRISRLRRIGCFRRFIFMPEYDLEAEKICHVFSAHPAMKIQEPSEPDHQAIWMSPEEAVRLVANPGDAHFLQRVFQ